MATRRPITAAARRQLTSGLLQCNNRPGNPNLSFWFVNSFGTRVQYQCPMWRINNGMFDQSGYEIDHIQEFAAQGADDISNFQLLCPCCHSFKTKQFVCQRRVNGRCVYTSEQIGGGAGPMNTEDQQKGKRQRIESMDLSFGKNSDLKYLEKIKIT
jgi:hypothetical protein